MGGKVNVTFHNHFITSYFDMEINTIIVFFYSRKTIFLIISLSGNTIFNIGFRGSLMQGKVNVSFYNQYESK